MAKRLSPEQKLKKLLEQQEARLLVLYKQATSL